MKQGETSSNNKNKYSRNSKIFSIRTALDTFETKEEKLFGNKSFIETILGLIKKTQCDVLSNRNFSSFHVKNLLIDLKKDLIEINKEEIKKVNLNENLLNDKKEKIKEIIFDSNQSNYILPDSNEENDVNSIKHKLMLENNSVDIRKEINQLEFLNFKMKNEIKKMDNLIKRIRFEKNIYNKNNDDPEEPKFETIYIKQSDNKLVNKILHNKLIYKRKMFIRRVNIKNNQDICLIYIKDKITNFKKDLNDLYKYYDEYIISEEEKSYIETIIEDIKNNKIENNISNVNSIDINKIEMKKAQLNDESDSLDKNSSNKDSSNNEETCPNSLEKNRIEL